MTKLTDCNTLLTTPHVKVSLLIKETWSWYFLIPFLFLIHFVTVLQTVCWTYVSYSPSPICWPWDLAPGNNRSYCLVHTRSIFFALVVKKLSLLFSGHEKRHISIVHIDQHLLFFSLLIDIWYNNFLQMFDNFLSVAIVLLVNTCTKFCRKSNFWEWLVIFTSINYLEWQYFSIECDCQSHCNAALVSNSNQTNTSWFLWYHCNRPTVTYFDSAWSLLSTRDWMLCFSIILTIPRWCWSNAFFLAPSGTSTFPVVATHLWNPSLWRILYPHIGVVLMFLRDKSSLLLCKTFAVVDAIL